MINRLKRKIQLEQIIQRLEPLRIAVVAAEDEKVLAGVKIAMAKGIVFDPISLLFHHQN